MQISKRLTSERLRLGMTQAEAAETCGVTRSMWGRYEKGKASMGCDVLVRFASVGGDVNFILTGIRVEQGQLSPRESALLENYRNCHEDGQRSLETTSALLAQCTEKLDDAG